MDALKLTGEKMNIKLFTKKNITVFCIILSAILILLTTIVCIKNSRNSAVKLSSTLSDAQETLIAKNKLAHTGIIKEKGEAQFAFNANHKDMFYKVYEKDQSAALVVRVKFNPTASQKELLTSRTELPFNLGILYSEDFDKNKNFNLRRSFKKTFLPGHRTCNYRFFYGHSKVGAF